MVRSAVVVPDTPWRHRTRAAVLLGSDPLPDTPMRLSHVTVSMPPGREADARAFYGGLLGLTEIPKPDSVRARGGVWFDAGGLDLHVSIEEGQHGVDARRHFGLECRDLDAVRRRLDGAGIAIDPGRPAAWRRFFAWDPFGNRIEFHEVGGLRA